MFEQFVNSRAVTISPPHPTPPPTAGRRRSHVVDLDSSVYATDPGYFFVAHAVHAFDLDAHITLQFCPDTVSRRRCMQTVATTSVT